VRLDNFAASWGSSPGRDAKRGPAALLLLVALAPAMAVAQPQPVFTELFAYDPSAPSQLLGKWLISSQLDSKSQPLRVGVVEDRIGKTVGRITVQEGDGLAGANEAMLQARDYICNSEGSRAAAVEAEPGGVVPSERAEIQVRSDRATDAGELVKFGEPCGTASPSRSLTTGRTTFRSWDASSAAPSSTKSSKIPSRAGNRATPALSSRSKRVHSATACVSSRRWPLAHHAPPSPMVTRAQICRRDLPRESWTTVQVRLNPAHDASGQVDIWLNGTFCGTHQGPMADRAMAPAATARPSSTHSRGSAFIVTGAPRPRRSSASAPMRPGCRGT